MRFLYKAPEQCHVEMVSDIKNELKLEAVVEVLSRASKHSVNKPQNHASYTKLKPRIWQYPPSIWKRKFTENGEDRLCLLLKTHLMGLFPRVENNNILSDIRITDRRKKGKLGTWNILFIFT